MRLADFIERNSELILAEWVTFAESCGPAGNVMNVEELRDHAADMLKAIVLDLRTTQTDAEQTAKSMGDAPPLEDGGAETAAEVHGAGRAESGFTIGEMLAEYRALRASVVRLWTKNCTQMESTDFDDLLRFNETIDQAIAESVTRYTVDIERSKEVFLGILGHDLRSPLGAVLTASQFILDTGELVEPNLSLVKRIAHAGRRMNTMVGELLDFTRSRLGSGMPIVRREMDLAKETASAVDEARSAYPDATFLLNTSGNLVGSWDCARISQVLSNLLGNAVQHGSPKTTISLTARGEQNEVVLQVHNRGVAIQPSALANLFSPFKGLQPESEGGSRASLGLGLYIVERIVTAHRGHIDITSTDAGGTFFTVRLPRVNGAVERAPQ